MSEHLGWMIWAYVVGALGQYIWPVKHWPAIPLAAFMVWATFRLLETAFGKVTP